LKLRGGICSILPNAVNTQIRFAAAGYVPVAIVKKRLDPNPAVYEILQILSISIFDKTPNNTMFRQSYLQDFKDQDCKQLTLFDF
jgi:hypothetical protein